MTSAGNGGEEEVAKFEAWLDTPIPGWAVSDRVVQDELAQFKATTGAREATA